MNARPPSPAGNQSPEPATVWLVQRTRNGADSEAKVLYDRLAPALLAWIHLQVQPRMGGRFEAEDLLQEIWLRILDLLPSFDPNKGGFRAWVFQIARFVALECLRKAIRENPSLVFHQSDPCLARLKDGEASVSTNMAQREASSLLLAFLNDLAPREKKLMILCGMEERPVREAAAALELSQAAAEKSWQRLRTRLRQDPSLKRILFFDE